MPRKASAPKDPIPVASTHHKDKRKNIPTRELQDFVKDDCGPFADFNGLPFQQQIDFYHHDPH